MANRNVKVIGHWQDGNGKTLLHHGTGNQFLLNVATQIGPDGAERLDPAQVQTKLTGAGKVPNGVWVTTGYQFLDSNQVPAGIL